MEIVIKLLELEKAKVQTEIAEILYRDSERHSSERKSEDDEMRMFVLLKKDKQLDGAISLLENK